MVYSFKAFLFDFDGVIVDTEDQYTEFWNDVSRRLLPSVPDLAFRLKGNTLLEALRTYFPSKEVQGEIVEGLARFQEHMRYPDIAGAPELVGALAAEGVATAVVTASDRRKMGAVYRQRPDIQKMFTRIFTSEDYDRSKPAPDCYIEAAHALRCEPEECIVAEDSINGLRAARASGAVVLALATTCPREEVARYGDAVIDDFREFTPQMAEALFKRLRG